jgi:ATP-binding cassette subfamily F protein uup
VGGYSDWLRQRRIPEGDDSRRAAAPVKPPPRQATKPRAGGAKLSYKDKRELEELPGRIEALEAEQQRLHQRMADPALYQGDGNEVVRARARLAEVDAELNASYERWESLEALSQPAS